MPEVSRGVISGKILTLSMNEGVFGKLKNRLGMISGRNIKRVRLRWWKAQVPFVGHLSIMDSTRASCVKPGFGRFRSRKRMRNVRLHARHYHLCYALSTQRRVSVTEAVIIPRKISIIPPQVSPTSRGKMPKAPPLWRILRRNWRDRTRYRYKIVIGGTQRRRKCDSISRRIRG